MQVRIAASLFMMQRHNSSLENFLMKAIFYATETVKYRVTTAGIMNLAALLHRLNLKPVCRVSFKWNLNNARLYYAYILISLINHAVIFAPYFCTSNYFS